MAIISLSHPVESRIDDTVIVCCNLGENAQLLSGTGHVAASDCRTSLDLPGLL